jgi:hypothetical protein
MSDETADVDPVARANAVDVGLDEAYSFDPGRPDWLDRAACLGIIRTDPEYYAYVWPARHVGAATKTFNYGRFIEKYCDRCPVRDECRDYANRSNSLGIWGGDPFRWGENLG